MSWIVAVSRGHKRHVRVSWHCWLLEVIVEKLRLDMSLLHYNRCLGAVVQPLVWMIRDKLHVVSWAFLVLGVCPVGVEEQGHTLLVICFDRVTGCRLSSDNRVKDTVVA